ncbi:peptidoglycan-binding protein [Anatilimnocola sp. NA78]|uniref:peptidoglycan-binding domain-containing protein n=1 Tax=Anatilimnocola sp. NA78 TaxID=3415683 RepID=UPI003CE461C6
MIIASISGSVGSYESGAKNQQADIRTVQELLTQAAKKLNSPGFDPKGIDGKIGKPGSNSKTVAAITAFQKQQVGMSLPDQRIDVNGATWKKLVAVAGSLPAKPASAATQLITLTVTHGGKIPKGTKFKVATAATATSLYESTFTLSGGASGTFRGSIFPDDMTIKGRLLDDTYPLHLGFHKGGGTPKEPASSLVVKTSGVRAGLLVNARNSVKVKSDNSDKTTSHGINVHNGYSETDRGSDGCLTLHPSDWSSFVKIFLNAFPDIADWHTLGNNTGKKIGSLVIKK